MDTKHLLIYVLKFLKKKWSQHATIVVKKIKWHEKKNKTLNVLFLIDRRRERDLLFFFWYDWITTLQVRSYTKTLLLTWDNRPVLELYCNLTIHYYWMQTNLFKDHIINKLVLPRSVLQYMMFRLGSRYCYNIWIINPPILKY